MFDPAWVEGSPPASDPPAPTEWRFDGTEPEPAAVDWPQTRGWEPLFGVRELSIRDGRLVGQSTSDLPILRLRRTDGLDDHDPLHEIQVRMKATAGTRVGVHFASSTLNDIDRSVAEGRNRLWMIGAPIVGDELQTLTFSTPFAIRSSDIHQIFVRPTDVADARFEIESIRLVLRRELLATKPTGIGWEGLSDTYREAVVARAPESFGWRFELPSRPRLDLNLGTLDERPVTFRVHLEPAAGAPAVTLVERTLTTPERWQRVGLDLDAYAGSEVTLRFDLEAQEDGVVGLWGSPAVRQRVAAARPDEPQGVVFVLADTLRPDRLELFGHDRETAPTITRLARQGATFRDAQAQGTWTKVSTPSMFTSLYPQSNGVTGFMDRLPSSATTLAEVFRQAGYATIGFSSVQFTGKFGNMHQGYEEMHEVFSLGDSKNSRNFVDRLLPWLEAHRDQRFFVFLHVFDPHAPFEPRSPWDAQWADPDWHGEHRRAKEHLSSFIPDQVRQVIKMPTRDEVVAGGMDPEEFIERELAWYDGSIRGMDQELGRLAESLKELGLDDRTLWVVTSDHGEEFHDHGSMNHGHSVYSELTRVPLVLRYPGVVPAGVEVTETVQLIDVMPTVLELAGLPTPGVAQGQSLVPLIAAADGASLNSSAWRPRPAISQRFPMPFPTVPPEPATESTALVFDGWKLVHHQERLPETPEYELFDRRTDPMDQIDVAADHPEVVERLSGLLEEWREQVSAERLPGDDEVQDELSAQELERLRALGYVS